MDWNEKLYKLLKKKSVTGKALGQIIVGSLAASAATGTDELNKKLKATAGHLLKTPKQERIYYEYNTLYSKLIDFYNHYEYWRMEAILKAVGLCSTITIVRASEIIQTLDPERANPTGVNGLDKLQRTRSKKLINVRDTFDVAVKKLTSYNKLIDLISDEYDVEINGLKKDCRAIISDSIKYSHQREAVIDELKERKNQGDKIKTLKKYFAPIIPTICTEKSLAEARKMLKNRNTDLGDNIRDILAMLTDKQVLRP